METKTGSTEQPSSAEQELSQQEIAPHVLRLNGEFRNILKSWPELNGAALDLFLTNDKFHPKNTVVFTRGGVSYEVQANEGTLEITRAEKPEGFEEDGWTEDGERRRRVSSKSLYISAPGKNSRFDHRILVMRDQIYMGLQKYIQYRIIRKLF